MRVCAKSTTPGESGHVPINHHMLSDFRVAHQEALDAIIGLWRGPLGACGSRRDAGAVDAGGMPEGGAGAGSAGDRASRSWCDAASGGAGARGERASGSRRPCRTCPGHKRRRNASSTPRRRLRSKITKARVHHRPRDKGDPDGGFRPAYSGTGHMGSHRRVRMQGKQGATVQADGPAP